jgi:hypothetical protein
MSRYRWPVLAVVLVAIAGLVGGCGSSTGGGAASSRGDGSAAHAASSAHQKGVAFAACMRRNGVQDFPDPPASGNFTIDQIANGSSLDTSTPAFNHALQACRSLEPGGFTGTKRNHQQQSAALKFAECMRQNGVPDFPDPTAGQPLIDTYNIPSANKPGGMAILNATSQKCKGDLNAALAGQH